MIQAHRRCEGVAALFECTGDLGGWTGEASLETTVGQKEAEGNVLRFEVTPGDGMAARAFLRIGEGGAWREIRGRRRFGG